MTRPRIALTVSASQTAEGKTARLRYVRALERAGAEVVEVAPGAEAPIDVDALCLSGGGDIAPTEYGADDPADVCRDIDERRDHTELEVVRSALQNAASVSTLLLTSDALVADAPKEGEKKSGGNGGGGYDDMY